MTDQKHSVDPDDPQEVRRLRKRQRDRATVMALGLGGLCVLFFLITLVKIGLWG